MMPTAPDAQEPHLIFDTRTARAIEAGRITQTRRPANGPCRYRVAHDYAAGLQGVRLKVTAVREQRNGDMTFEDARAEGYKTPRLRKIAWVRKYDAAWIKRELVDLAAVYDDHCSIVDWILSERFEQRHAPKRVHVVSFEIVPDVPRFLAQPGPNQGDYTEQRHRAIDDLEVVPAQYQEKLSKDALGFCIGRQQKRAREQAEAKAERGRSMRLAPHERFRRAA